MKRNLPFVPADILIPKANHEKWAVVACDQFTSEPEYWQKAADIADGFPSALKIILPEVYLDEPDIEKRIENINRNMDSYLNKGIFEEFPDALIFVERTLSDGRVRRGIVGAVCLADYDYTEGSKPLIRTTEGTVLSRIPPRVKIRRDAALELPHVMILIDDIMKTVIESIYLNECRVVYDFDLMLGGGHLKGYLLDKKQQTYIFSALSALMGDEDTPMLFAIGDGNHSLATAKACSLLTDSPLAGYALAEIVNIHDPALDFEPIYRIIFNADTEDLLNEIKKRFTSGMGNKVEYFTSSENGDFFVDGLASDVLQKFIDDYISRHNGVTVDYIHGEESLKKLSCRDGACGFIFDGIAKSELFPYVREHGALPRKTFSMGEACDKRYYMECRKIK